MDRNREMRRMNTSNGLSRRRQRNTSSSRNSPENGVGDFHEPTRLRERENRELRDRGSVVNVAAKKDRERPRSTKRLRRDSNNRLLHGSSSSNTRGGDNGRGGGGGDDSSDTTSDDDDEDVDDDLVGSMRMPPPNSTSSSNHHQNNNQHQNNHHRRSFPPNKGIRAAPISLPPALPAPSPAPGSAPGPAYKVADDIMIGVPVPRKARSACVKRSHDNWSSSGGGGGGYGGGVSVGGGGGGAGGELSTNRQPSPVAQSIPVPSSPSSSNVSMKKKKPVGVKLKPPPKVASKSSTVVSASMQDDEMEVAEVLFGLKRHPQYPPKQDTMANVNVSSHNKRDSHLLNDGLLVHDAKSRVSSPMRNSPSSVPYQMSMFSQNSSSSATPLPATAPKRKRPRPVKFDEESSANFTARSNFSSSSKSKLEKDQQVDTSEVSSPRAKKKVGSPVGGAGVGVFDLGSSQPESAKADVAVVLDSNPSRGMGDNERDRANHGMSKTESVASSTKLGSVDAETARSPKLITTSVDNGKIVEEKFEIDLMAPPMKSSSDRDGFDDPKSVVNDADMVQKTDSVVKCKENNKESNKEDVVDVMLIEKKTDVAVDKFEPHKQQFVRNKERVLDLKIDLEKQDQSVDGNSNHQKGHKEQQHQQQSKAPGIEPKLEKAGQLASLPLPMNVARWPGPPHGYAAGQFPPLQGVLPVNGNVAGSSNSVQPPIPPKPQRCATHYYIAHKIFMHQQIGKMNPFWSAAAGAVAQYGAKSPYTLNSILPPEAMIVGNPMPGMCPGRTMLDQKTSTVATSLSSHSGKEKTSGADVIQKKQQSGLPQSSQQSAVANQIMPSPAYIFPLGQQQSLAASRAGVMNNVKPGNSLVSSGAPNAAQGKSSSGAPAMSFNYQNMPVNESQYLALLQSSGYPFPIQSPVGAPPPYRGGNTHPAQAMPFFNAPFFPSQMLQHPLQLQHPSQLQQQQQQQQQQQHAQQDHSQPQHQQSHQNTSTSSGSSSSQKQQQNMQQRVHVSGNGGASGSSHNNIPISKNRVQQYHQQNRQVPRQPHQARQFEVEMGGESPSTADSRVSHAPHKSLPGQQNFAVPLNNQNFVIRGGGKQQQNLKGGGGMELMPSQAFAMSFANFNGAVVPPGLDFSSMTQNHAIFQSLPESARQNHQITLANAAVQAAHDKKNQGQVSEERKSVSDTVSGAGADEERKVKSKIGLEQQSLVFSRDESATDQSSSAVLMSVNNNRGAYRSVTSGAAATGAANMPSSSQQQHQLMYHQLQKQQQHQIAASRTKQSTQTNANFYTDRTPSSMAPGKFSNSAFPQNHLIEGTTKSAQSPQWKNPTRAATSSPAPPPSSMATSLKNPLSQQQQQQQHQSRVQEGQAQQISFGMNQKSVTTAYAPTQSPSPPMIMGSPPASASGSPRTATPANKISSTTLSSQQQHSNKSTQPSGASSRKSSPVGGRNVPSVLGHSHLSSASASASASSSATKPPTPQQQLQQLQLQQIHKAQQAQLFFPNTFSMHPQAQAQSPQYSGGANNVPPNSTGSAVIYNQLRQEQMQKLQQQQMTSAASVGGPTPITDPAKAVASASAKGGAPQQFVAHSPSGGSTSLVSAPFQYIHAALPVQAKQSEHKQQPAGNDNLQSSWQPEKKR